MAQTPNYKLTAFGDALHPDYSDALDLARMTTIDNQLWALLSQMGSGVLSGLVPDPVDTGTTAVTFTWGEVVIDGLYGKILPPEGETRITVDLSEWIREDAGTTTVYVYAQKTAATAATGTVRIDTAEIIPTDATGLAQIIVSATGNPVSLAYNADPYIRPTIGLSADLLALIEAHHHSGEPGSPTKVNLATEVQGLLDAARITGDIPASKITGTIPLENVQLSHTDLDDIGRYTHEDLDRFYTYLNTTLHGPWFEKYGLVGIVNHLRMVLTLMRRYPTDATIYQQLVNERPLVPGVNPTSGVGSWVNNAVNRTTANIDATNKVIDCANGTPINPNATPPGMPVTAQWDGMTDAIGQATDASKEFYGFGTDAAPSSTRQSLASVHIFGTDADATIELAHENDILYRFQTGSFYARIDATKPVTWTSVDWLADVWEGTTLSVAVTAVGTGSLTPPTAGWKDVSVQGPVPDGTPRARYAWLKVTMTTDDATHELTPLLKKLSITYDGSAIEQCNVFLYDRKAEWEDDGVFIPSTVSITETPCGLSDVTLLSHPIYATMGTALTPIYDGGAAVVWWDRAFTAYTLPEDCAIQVEVRNSDDTFADLVTGWSALTFTEAVDLSALHKRYLQLRYTLLGPEDGTRTPQIVGTTMLWHQADTADVQEQVFYFAEDNDGPSGWHIPGATLTNLDTDTVKGGITIADPALGEGRWVSPVITVTEGSFIDWKELGLRGEGLERVQVGVSFSDDGITWNKHMTYDAAGTNGGWSTAIDTSGDPASAPPPETRLGFLGMYGSPQFVTNIGGATPSAWEPVAFPQTFYDIDSADGTKMLATTYNGSGAWISTDSGFSWTEHLNTLGASWGVAKPNCCAISAEDDNYAILGFGGGQIWAAVDFQAANPTFVQVTNLPTLTGTVTYYRVQFTPGSSTEAYIVGGRIDGATTYPIVLKLTRVGSVWTGVEQTINTPGNGPLRSLSIGAAGCAFASGNNRQLYRLNGVAWDPVTIAGANAASTFFHVEFTAPLTSYTDYTVYVWGGVAATAELWKTVNAGAAWSNMAPAGITSAISKALAAGTVDPDGVVWAYAYADKEIYRYVGGAWSSYAMPNMNTDRTVSFLKFFDTGGSIPPPPQKLAAYLRVTLTLRNT